MSQSRLPDRNLSRSAAEKVKGDVGVVCGARKPLGTPARRGGSGMRNLRDGVPGDQRGDRGLVGDWRDMLPGDQGDRGDCGSERSSRSMVRTQRPSLTATSRRARSATL